MATRRSYPLAALEELRRRLVDEARGALAEALAAAEAARAVAEEAAAAHLRAVERRRTGERRVPGGLLLDELQSHGSWLAALRREERRLESVRAGLLDEAARAAAAEERGRGHLIEAERQLRVVERHRAMWQAARLREERDAEEAEQEDQSAARAGQRWR